MSAQSRVHKKKRRKTHSSRCLTLPCTQIAMVSGLFAHSACVAHVCQRWAHHVCVWWCWGAHSSVQSVLLRASRVCVCRPQTGMARAGAGCSRLGLGEPTMITGTSRSVFCQCAAVMAANVALSRPPFQENDGGGCAEQWKVLLWSTFGSCVAVSVGAVHVSGWAALLK